MVGKARKSAAGGWARLARRGIDIDRRVTSAGPRRARSKKRRSPPTTPAAATMAILSPAPARCPTVVCPGLDSCCRKQQRTLSVVSLRAGGINAVLGADE